MKKTDEFWMKQCFSLARRGAGMTSPNPLVGAVIVKNGRKISQGYHKKYGDHHAEINAINSTKNKKLLQGATLYVNLEPCAHYGKTPPCINSIIQFGFTRVVISTIDPNPLVDGKSVKILRSKGVRCEIGILGNEGLLLNEKYFKFITTKLPFISLKSAQTQNGFIARSDGTSKWITNSASRKYVHQLRSQYDAVLVGAGTVKKDDPSLTVRTIKGRNPLRIVIDGRFSLSIKKKIFNEKAPTIVYTAKILSGTKKRKLRLLEKKGIDVVQLNSKNYKIDINQIMKNIAGRQISSVFIEGGQRTYGEFLDKNLVDKIYLFTSLKRYNSGLSLFGSVKHSFTAELQKTRLFGKDTLEEYYLI